MEKISDNSNSENSELTTNKLEEKKEYELSEQFQNFYNTIVEEIDKKFFSVEEQLDVVMKEILGHTKSHLFEINEEGKNLNILEEQVLGTTQKKPEDLVKFKNLAQDYIKKCEDLDSYLLEMKDLKLKDMLKIGKKGFHPNSAKLNYLKKYIKSNSDITWRSNQKKVCYITQEGRCMDITFSSCWNDFHSTTMTSGQHDIFLKIINTNCSTNYSIAITNENFNRNNINEICIGCQSTEHAWILKPSNFYSGITSNYSGISIPNNGTIKICIQLDLDAKTVLFIDEKGSKSQVHKIQGSEFKVTVGQCTSGSSKYEFIEDY
jgi:hypothetical protein